MQYVIVRAKTIRSVHTINSMESNRIMNQNYFLVKMTALLDTLCEVTGITLLLPPPEEGGNVFTLRVCIYIYIL